MSTVAASKWKKDPKKKKSHKAKRAHYFLEVKTNFRHQAARTWRVWGRHFLAPRVWSVDWQMSFNPCSIFWKVFEFFLGSFSLFLSPPPPPPPRKKGGGETNSKHFQNCFLLSGAGECKSPAMLLIRFYVLSITQVRRHFLTFFQAVVTEQKKRRRGAKKARVFFL